MNAPAPSNPLTTVKGSATTAPSATTAWTRGGHSTELTDSIVKRLPAPAKGNRITYDSRLPGFGIRVTAAGARAFVLTFRTRSGRERRFTIGRFPGWQTKAARQEAERLKRRIRDGHDPLAEIEAERDAPTVATLCERFTEKYLSDQTDESLGLRKSTREAYASMIEREVLPVLKHLKVAEVSYSDIEDLHHRISRDSGATKRRRSKKGRPYYANRVIALVSRLFNLAVRWKWCAANPVKGIERNREEKRRRYLSNEEVARLSTALADLEDQQGADAIRLLLLSGARRNEVLSMKWDAVDLSAGTWSKPGSATKQRTPHSVPLSAPARQILARLRKDADPDAEYVFPGRSGGHRIEIRRAWDDACKAAQIKAARVHDLRHSFASQLASAGFPLATVAELLGHTNVATTARYSHLFDSVARQATERVAQIMASAGLPAADPIPLKGRKRR